MRKSIFIIVLIFIVCGNSFAQKRIKSNPNSSANTESTTIDFRNQDNNSKSKNNDDDDYIKRKKKQKK